MPTWMCAGLQEIRKDSAAQVGGFGVFGGNPFCENSWRYRPRVRTGSIPLSLAPAGPDDGGITPIRPKIGPISARIPTEPIPTERT